MPSAPVVVEIAEAALVAPAATSPRDCGLEAAWAAAATVCPGTVGLGPRLWPPSPNISPYVPCSVSALLSVPSLLAATGLQAQVGPQAQGAFARGVTLQQLTSGAPSPFCLSSAVCPAFSTPLCLSLRILCSRRHPEVHDLTSGLASWGSRVLWGIASSIQGPVETGFSTPRPPCRRPATAFFKRDCARWVVWHILCLEKSKFGLSQSFVNVF